MEDFQITMLLSIDVSLKTPKLCKADACVRIREERLKPRVVMFKYGSNSSFFSLQNVTIALKYCYMHSLIET